MPTRGPASKRVHRAAAHSMFILVEGEAGVVVGRNGCQAQVASLKLSPRCARCNFRPESSKRNIAFDRVFS
jgi:hypothetical protein